MTMGESKHYYRLGLVGYPLGHSFSPRLHAAALRAAGLDGGYILYPVQPGEAGEAALSGLVEDVRAGRLDGLNVTIPHKQRVMVRVDLLSEAARAVGAVNTLVRQAGAVRGENTDVAGFLADLAQLWNLREGKALILGAGGAGRAAAYALASQGWQVKIISRRRQMAEKAASELALAGVMSGQLCAGELRGSEADLVVNATPAGMSPDLTGCPWPDEIPLPHGSAVYDMVYNPVETVLVKRAKAAGLRSANGLGMLAAQAALSFSLWTGCAAPYAVMAKAARVAAEQQGESGA